MTEWNDESNDLLDDLIRHLEEAWRSGREVNLAGLVPAADNPIRRSALVALIQVDQELRWRRSDHKSLQQYLGEWPELQSQGDKIAELQAAENKLRAEAPLPLVQPKALDRAESVFAAAEALATAEEQASYLAQACAGDPGLRERVEALLRAHDRAGDLLNRPVPGGVEKTAAYVPREQPGTVIAGRYKLLEAIGEGGMGAVWVAEQTQPVRRKVALKLIKAGMDSKSVLARFEAERQALAVMDHPNIAKVFDGGLTDAGRPFFVMEYVKGVPITEYCDATRLSVPERLQLFVQVCHAVQHAHQKGIIHRDLKPSNILVAPYDDRPIPKVIDFGLAKAIHQPLTERTVYTAHEMVLGTPLYMSPEQAQLNNLDIDTRSDLYSLGVLLYELLTGTTPLEKQRFKEAAWDEVRRIIREEEPPRPSMRLSSSQTLPSLAAGRQLEPAQLTKLVRGDLDWIVLKALEKDRTRRYETANSFALDVQRYLAGEPVVAAPPSARYRLQKFTHKHRAALTTAAAMILLLLAGAAFSTWQAVRATLAEAAARAAEQDALQAQRAETERAEGERLAKLDAKAKQADSERQKSRAEAGEKLASERLVQVDAERKKAEEEKERADSQLLCARTAQYAIQINRAQSYLLENSFEDASDLLYGCDEDLCGWEHSYLCTDIGKGPIVLQGHEATVSSVAFSPDGKRIASGSKDKTVKVWDVATGKVTITLDGHAEEVSSVAFSPDGKQIASGSKDKSVKVWNVATGKVALTLKGHTQSVKSVSFSPIEHRIVSGGGELGKPAEIKIWNLATGEEAMTLKGHADAVSSVSFSADGLRIVSGSWDNTLKVWDSQTGLEMLTLKGHRAPVTLRLVKSGKININPKRQRGSGLAPLPATGVRGSSHHERYTSAAFSPDGRRIVSGSDDATMQVWDVATRQETLTLKGHTQSVNSVAFSADGRRIISGSVDNTLKVWDAATGQEMLTLTLNGHAAHVSCVAFSANGRWIAAGSLDNSVKIWGAATGRDRGTLRIVNNMPTQQHLLVNGRTHYWIEPLSYVDANVPTGMATTQLVGSEPAMSWFLGPPNYIQEIIIDR